ncbi:MAG: TolC family protein, partial [Candidatus Glassbacteria bacterium]|nr:TolC family protein [Candidatus Glassbacteria bacterium]
AQVELGRMEDRLKSLEDYRGALAAVLNSELNLPPDTPLPWPPEPETGEVLPAEEELFGLLAERNPELKALDYNLEKEKTAIDLAGKDFYPDITLGLDYLQTGRALMPGTPDDSKDPVMATVSVNLPLNRGKYRAAGREARNRYGAARLERQDSQNRLEARLKAALFAFRDAGRRLSLYRDVLVPKAEQSLGAARQAYTTAGGADFLDLIEAQRTLLEFRLSGEKALVDRAKALAEIELLTGTDKIYL